MMVAWHNVLGLREVTRIVVEIICPFQISRLVGSWRFVLALRRYLPMLVLFRLLKKHILFGGCRRAH